MPYRLPEQHEKAGYVRRKFDEIARHYDRFNDLITQGQHRYWKRVLVQRLGIRPGMRGLDLCCGTGDIAARCLRALDGDGTLVAADFSREMLRIARQRLARTGGPDSARWSVLEGDAMRLPFADGSFDFITVGYGLRNVTHLEGCLDELLRVLRPGGRLASLDVGKVRVRWMRPLADLYFFHVVPWMGRLLQPGQEMFAYLPHSSVDYPEQQRLKAIMAERGYDEVAVLEFLWGASVIHLARRPA